MAVMKHCPTGEEWSSEPALASAQSPAEHKHEGLYISRPSPRGSHCKTPDSYDSGPSGVTMSRFVTMRWGQTLLFLVDLSGRCIKRTVHMDFEHACRCCQ